MILLLLGVSVLLIVRSLPGSQALPGSQVFTILFTNDLHSKVKEGKYSGMGAGKLKTIIDREKQANPNTLLFDAGDAFFGSALATITEGKGGLKVMNALGYDAMALGNHEFDFGVPKLQTLANQLTFPILSANTRLLTGESDANGESITESLMAPYSIMERGGTRFGVIGLTTPDTVHLTHPK